MKRVPIFTLLLLTTFTLGLAQISHAQVSQVFRQFFDWHNEASMGELRSFNDFLQNHPETARDLRENPNRVNDREFLERHEDLRRWFDEHPNAARAFHENPQGFMDHVRDFRRYGGDYNANNQPPGNGEQRGYEQHTMLARFDWFLDSHPEIRRELMNRPELATSDDYLGDHPDLREFLDRYPEIRERLRDHPQEFMEREARFERERNHGEE